MDVDAIIIEEDTSEDELHESEAEQELFDFQCSEKDVFERESIRTKEALIESIEQTRKRYQEQAASGKGNHSASFYAVLDDLLDQFALELLIKKLPEPLNEWWSYSYVITSCGIKLMMNYYEWTHDYGGSFDCSRAGEIMLFEMPAKMLTVSEYAAMNGVESVTVRQWIRRAKIRSAVKYGREWLIPELAEIPKEKGYTPCHYYWKSTLSDLPAKFAFLNEFRSAYIDKDEEDKDKFLLSLSVGIPGVYTRMLDAIAGTGTEIELEKIKEVFKMVPDAKITGEGKLIITSKERAEIELYMIGCPVIQCQTLDRHDHQIEEIGTNYCGMFLTVNPA